MSSDTEYKPEIPAGLRKVTYWIGIGLAALALLVTGFVAIFWQDYIVQTLAGAGVINTVMLYISAQLAVKYVPPAIPNQ